MRVLILLLLLLISCGKIIKHPISEYDCEYLEVCDKDKK